MKNWWKESVIYQIYPRSFQDTNGDGIGDIKGIISHLDYLKYLGVDILWLCPVYDSPNEDNGYDIRNYETIMNDFGTMEDFDLLLTEAHNRGLKIIMDLVVNHTSDEHYWFKESRKSIDNPYRDFYIWRKEPNKWDSLFEGSAWEYDKTTDMYYLHFYSKKQPDLNWDNPKVRNSVYNIMRFWLDKGIDGFRMDVINQISKDFTKGHLDKNNMMEYMSNGPHVHEYLQEMYNEVLYHYDIMTVGETSEVTVNDAIKYAGFNRNELNMIFQFEHMSLDKGDMSKLEVIRPNLLKLKRILSHWQTSLHGLAWNSLYWNNHDRPRVVSKYGDDSLPLYWEKSAKMLAVMLHMMEGTPYIYQGEELGMTNVDFTSIDQYRDIDALNKYNVYKKDFDEDTILNYFKKRSRDNARTPMQWNKEKNAGFTLGNPWIDINSNYLDINAEDALKDKNSIFYFYKKLIDLRKTYSVIVYGSYECLLQDDPNIFVYKRILDNQELLVICNYTKDVQIISDLIVPSDMELLITNYYYDTVETLRPYEAKVYLKTFN